MSDAPRMFIQGYCEEFGKYIAGRGYVHEGRYILEWGSSYWVCEYCELEPEHFSKLRASEWPTGGRIRIACEVLSGYQKLSDYLTPPTTAQGAVL